MHRELCGISDLIHVVDGIDLVYRYWRFWTARRMRRPAPVAFLTLGLIRDVTKVCQDKDWLFKDRERFLAYKTDLLLL